MEDEFLKGRAAHIREMAASADPFIRKRLLDLAKTYEGDGSKLRRLTPLSITPANFPTKQSDERG